LRPCARELLREDARRARRITADEAPDVRLDTYEQVAERRDHRSIRIVGQVAAREVVVTSRCGSHGDAGQQEPQ